MAIVELRDRRQVREVYTIRQVAEMTGVPDNTIRSWERRFGIPRPDRSGSNQRRYHQRDIDAIRSIQAARERGQTMEQAIQEVLATDWVSADQDTAVDMPPPTEPAAPVAATPIVPEIDRLVGVLAEFDGAGADRLAADRAWATSIDDACVALLLPAADAIANLAAAGHLSPVAARFAIAWVHGKLLAAFEGSNPGLGAPHVVVAAMHDDCALHDALGVAIMLSRAGYRVTWLGEGASVGEIEEAVNRLRPTTVVLAARSPLSIAAATGVFQRLADRREADADAWHGVSAVTGIAADAVRDAVALPIDAQRTVSTLESAMRTRESSLRLVRNS